MVLFLSMVAAAPEIKVFQLELEFELPENVLRFTHCHRTASAILFLFLLENDSQVVNKIGS